MLISEVEEVIRPLCRLLDIQMEEANDVRPFMIAVAGSVAVGKSTFARVIRALLAQVGRTVELVAIEGFLWPTAILEKRNLMHRKQVRAELLNGTLIDAYRVANLRFRGSSGFARAVH
jgi:type I pantothenate kinase